MLKLKAVFKSVVECIVAVLERPSKWLNFLLRFAKLFHEFEFTVKNDIYRLCRTTLSVNCLTPCEFYRLERV